jgi:hypothetical protein
LDLLFTYHPFWLLVILLVAFGYTFFLYRKDALLEEVGKRMKWLMASFRFLSVTFLGLLLLGIVLERFEERKEKPIVFIVQDNSASVILSKDSAFYKKEYMNQLKEISNKLSAKYNVINYSFDGDLKPEFKGTFDGKLTDISTVFSQLYTQYTNRNIGAIVLASDGVYNTGANPIYEVERKGFLPIFTIGMGDTSQVKDVRLEHVNHNEIAFLGNDFPVSVTYAQNLYPNSKVNISLFEGQRKIREKAVNFSGEFNQGEVLFTVKAASVGYRKYTVKISQLEGENSIKNNVLSFYIQVIDGRQKILLTANGPHPDVAALRSVIENNKNYEIDFKKVNDIKSINGYDLIVAHNYDGSNGLVNEAIQNGAVPSLFIVGNQTNVTNLANKKIGFSGINNGYEDVGIVLNNNFKEITLSPEITSLLSNVPPLQSPFQGIKFASAINILAFQQVGNIKLNTPAIYFTQKGKSKIGVIMGEGIWRWKLTDQVRNKTTQNFEDFFGKVMTYLALKENKDPFRVAVNNEYTENEEVVVKAELYNQSFELINEPEVAFNYTTENGEKFESFFIKTNEAYQLNLGKLNPGVYTWEAKANFQGTNYAKKGTFLVKELKIEWLNSVANHQVLRSLADLSGGEFYDANQLSELENELLNRDDIVTVVYQEKSFDDLIDYKWLFFLIVLLISVEWFFRKYHGAY